MKEAVIQLLSHDPLMKESGYRKFLVQYELRTPPSEFLYELKSARQMEGSFGTSLENLLELNPPSYIDHQIGKVMRDEYEKKKAEVESTPVRHIAEQFKMDLGDV